MADRGVRPDELDEMGNLSIALPPEAWQEILDESRRIAVHTRSAIRAALRRAGPMTDHLSRPPDWAEVQRELNELFHRYGLSVATGLTAEGVMIGSQDERVNAYNLGEVTAYKRSVPPTREELLGDG